MLQNRIIPALQIQDGSVVKSIKFKNHSYVGDPVNTVNIFNNMEVDEILVVDIDATNNIKYKLIEEIATECFMPLTYGGGISNIEQAKKIFGLGVEKIVIGENSFNNFKFLNEISKIFGSQSVVVSMDIKK
jgi:cyclase